MPHISQNLPCATSNLSFPTDLRGRGRHPQSKGVKVRTPGRSSGGRGASARGPLPGPPPSPAPWCLRGARGQIRPRLQLLRGLTTLGASRLWLAGTVSQGSAYTAWPASHFCAAVRVLATLSPLATVASQNPRGD